MILEKIVEFLGTCPFLADMPGVNVDHLGEDHNQISVEPTPSMPVTRRYIDDSTDRQYQFTIATIFDYDQDLTLQNEEFFENLQEWMEEQTLAGVLPELDGGKTATSIEAVSSGYMFGIDPTQRTARYQIQCTLNYTV